MGNTLIHEKTFQKTLRFGYQMSSGCEIAGKKKDAGTHVAGNYPHLQQKIQAIHVDLMYHTLSRNPLPNIEVL